ncbi:MAG: discoidin domain-containing protein, partial [Lentisphaeria bacterium]|nr:discoidin domain-containing protein [Lentisphaeria bacterium]
KYVMAATELDGVNSYYTFPFAVKIETAHKQPVALFSADSPETRENRQAWYNMVLGKKNLALKKSVRLIPKPRYHLTVDKPGTSKDAFDLTDGYITTMNTDKIWFDRRAVGFFADGKFTSNTAFLQLDLGSEQPVDYIAVRARGGAESGFKYPKKFEVYISKDGNTFFNAAELVKLAPAEANQSDFISTFYYPEERRWQQSVCKSFKLQVKADARYIIVKVTLDTHFFSDEMAVIAADSKGADFNRAYNGKGFAVPQDGLTIQPRVPELAVVKGVAAPQTLLVSDFRVEQVKPKSAVAVLELPEPLSVHRAKVEKVTIDGKKYNRCRVAFRKDMKLDPVYITSSADMPDTLPDAILYVEYDGKVGFKQNFPVPVYTLPEFQTFKKIPLCLAWMTTESLFHAYPDLLKNYKHFGFNGAGVFPRYWKRGGKAKIDAVIANSNAIHNAGLTVFMNESPVHVMANKQKTGSEVFCQTGKPNRVVCPSYTGKFYEKEMERVTENVIMSKPAHDLLDIECFGKAFSTSVAECTRCKE